MSELRQPTYDELVEFILAIDAARFEQASWGPVNRVFNEYKEILSWIVYVRPENVDRSGDEPGLSQGK